MKSLDAALTLLSQFMSSDPDFGVGELSERTGMPKSQVSKILSTFRRHGFLIQDPQTRRYKVDARAFALGVQDRVIRLEERLRLEGALTGDLRARIGDFTTEQLIGLRFASDAELEELAGRVLAEGISDRKAVKAMVKAWRPDHQRI